MGVPIGLSQQYLSTSVVGDAWDSIARGALQNLIAAPMHNTRLHLIPSDSNSRRERRKGGIYICVAPFAHGVRLGSSAPQRLIMELS